MLVIVNSPAMQNAQLFQGFYSCAEAATRKAIQNDGFRCSTVWWERFFPMDAEECALPKDLDEVVRMG